LTRAAANAVPVGWSNQSEDIDMKRRFAMVALAAVLAACAGTPEKVSTNQTLERYLAYAGEPVIRFTSFNGPRWWESLGRNKLVLWNTSNEAYLVTVWDTCPDLGFDYKIRVTSTNSAVSVFDKVYVGRDSCPIKEIRPIDVRRMKQDRKDMKAPE